VLFCSLREYHTLFGIHLAYLKGEMMGDTWEARNVRHMYLCMTVLPCCKFQALPGPKVLAPVAEGLSELKLFEALQVSLTRSVALYPRKGH